MGLFSVPLTVINTNAGRSETMAAIVDTAASYSMIPAEVMARLDIAPTGETRIRMADNSVVAIPFGDALIAVEGRHQVLRALFRPGGSRAILGANTLQELEFVVDPVNERLISIADVSP